MIGLATYLAIVVILAVGSIRKPAFALGAFLCMFALDQWGAAKIGFIASHGSFTNYLSCLIVATALARQLYRGFPPRILNGPIHILAILLFAFSAASLLWTPAPAVAIAEWRMQAPYLLLSLLVLPLLVQDDAHAKDGFVGTLIAGGILSACLAFLVQWGYRRIMSDVSAGSAIQLPLALAQVGAYIFVLATVYMRWTGWSAIAAIALAAVSVILVVKTGSRGQLLAMIASVIVFVPIARGRAVNLSLYMFFGIMAAGAIATAWWAFPALSGIFSPEQASRFAADRAIDDYEGRVWAAQQLLHSYLSAGSLHLMFGLGTSASFSPDIIGFYSHIVPVEILGELGFVGASLFVAILVLTARAIIKAVGSGLADDLDLRRVLISLAALFVCELLLSLKEGSLLRDVNFLLFPVLIEGVIASAKAKHHEVQSRQAPEASDVRSSHLVLQTRSARRRHAQ
jgi:O-antigen ligase